MTAKKPVLIIHFGAWKQVKDNISTKGNIGGNRQLIYPTFLQL